MTAWDPPREDGLSGEAYLSEEIEAFVDDLSDAHEPGVYVVKCSQPSSFDVVERRWEATFDADMPGWVRTAYDSDAVLYVGAAADVYDRITEHLEYPNRTSAVCRIYPIHSIWDVWWADDKQDAFTRESMRAYEVRAEYPGVYVHQR